MPKKEATTVEVTLTYNKDTKNTHQFVSNDDGAAVSALYINKSALDGAKVGPGTKLTLSIAVS